MHAELKDVFSLCSSRCRIQRFDTLRIYAGEVILEVKDLEAKVAETGQTILRGVNLTIREGEVRDYSTPSRCGIFIAICSDDVV